MHCFRISICLFAASLALSSNAEAQRRPSQNGGSDEISFVNDVVPIINAKCGSCHVTSSRGKYNIKSYKALMGTDSVTPKKPDDSLFIEMIENGEMPKGGKKVTDKELETLKQWIAAGAKFDGAGESDMIKASGGGSSRGTARGNTRTGRGQSRATGRRPSRGSRRGSAKPNAIETNKFLAFFDTDRDGKLSLSEIDAASRMLHSLDANEDDRVTSDELKKFSDK